MRMLTLDEIHYEEKEILKETVKFLDEHNLTYFITYGTLLGAVRHGGFIPWDDDIDLVMARPEYNKFVEYLKEHGNKISGNLEVIGLELNNSDFPILKIINKNIRVNEKDKADQYLWLDIFPLDATPKDNAKFFKRVSFLNNIFYLKRCQKLNVEIPANNKFKLYLKKIMLFILKLWPYDKYIRFYLKYATKYDYDKYDYVHNNVWASIPNVFPKDILKVKKYKFEDLMVNGFEDSDRALTILYGKDYMQLPPLEKRVTHEFEAWKVKE